MSVLKVLTDIITAHPTDICSMVARFKTVILPKYTCYLAFFFGELRQN